jgi:hypothetical protein
MKKGCVMKKRILFILIPIFAMCVQPNFCFASKKKEQLQELHKGIGENLISIRREHAGAQTTIYSLFDQVGKLYTLSKVSIEKKSMYKKLFKKEKAQVEFLKREMLSFKGLASDFKKQAAASEKELKFREINLSKLEKEREQITKEHEKFKMVTNEFEKEKYELTQERDSLLRERDALMHERDSLLREKGEDIPLVAKNPVKKGKRKIIPRV